jgi:hypothetical protein
MISRYLIFFNDAKLDGELLIKKSKKYNVEDYSTDYFMITNEKNEIQFISKILCNITYVLTQEEEND